MRCPISAPGRGVVRLVEASQIVTQLPEVSDGLSNDRDEGERLTAEGPLASIVRVTGPASSREDEVFDTVRVLIAQGEYRDELYGLPGQRLGGAGAIRNNRDGSQQRIYCRGTAEHLEAKAAGLVERLPPLPAPASAAMVADAERRLGYPLPPLLRRIYLELANGGFGPGYGILGVRGGHRDDDGNDLVASYFDWQQVWRPPKRPLLPLCHWGCAIYSFVDLASPPGCMWGYDPNPVPADELHKALVSQSITFVAWLERWAAGRLFQPTAVQDPSTGAWRSATDDEIAALL